MKGVEREAAYRAVRSRDRRFDGRFFVAVRTTRIYCRPGCPAPTPLLKNVQFYVCAAAAEAAGFRACLRCRPDAAPGSPAWRGVEVTVSRALRLIDDGGLDGDGVEALAARLGVGARHLRRLFAEHVGASPGQVALTRRVHFARKLLDETALPITQVAQAAGFASLRRFHASVRSAFGRAPRELRQSGGVAGERLLLRLPFRPPYDWTLLAAFLGARAVPGLERVDERGYLRAHGEGLVRVFPLDERALGLEVESGARPLDRLAARARRVFDLDADPLEIAAVLSVDRRLRPSLKARPGLRVPGAWDGFELAVRAIYGQQVSVAGATRMLGKLVAAHGVPLLRPRDGVTHRFPTAAVLRRADPSTLGVPRARGRALVALAEAVDDGRLVLDGSAPLDETLARLEELPGVGPWTAAYVAMRALGEPDAFPSGDLGLVRALGVEARALARRAEAWRPFRAYAAMHLWTWEMKR
jgi:AraC family transcriptional regulator, regulatory protein of adaptative response / DNA-3-methyladenine glycosylase II